MKLRRLRRRSATISNCPPIRRLMLTRNICSIWLTSKPSMQDKLKAKDPDWTKSRVLVVCQRSQVTWLTSIQTTVGLVLLDPWALLGIQARLLLQESFHLAFTAAGNQALGIRKPAATSPHTESPPSQLPLGPKLRTAISTQSSTSDDSWASRGDQADAMQRTAQLSLVTAPTLYQSPSSLPPSQTSSFEDNVRQASRRPVPQGHRDALPPLNPDPTTYQQYRAPMTGALPAMVADDRWRTMLPDAASRQMPDLPRHFHHPNPIGQSGAFGTSQLPPLPLVGPERLFRATA